MALRIQDPADYALGRRSPELRGRTNGEGVPVGLFGVSGPDRLPFNEWFGPEQQPVGDSEMPRKPREGQDKMTGHSIRRVRYAVAVTLDGFIAGPNGEADW